MKIKGQSIEEWKKWLEFQLQPSNPENLKDDEKYVLAAFLESIKIIEKD